DYLPRVPVTTACAVSLYHARRRCLLAYRQHLVIARPLFSCGVPVVDGVPFADHCRGADRTVEVSTGDRPYKRLFTRISGSGGGWVHYPISSVWVLYCGRRDDRGRRMAHAL